MQLIVLGMHRSGTSAVCRILNMMGAYFGPEGSSLGLTPENPKGFWERRDILNLSDAALFAVQANWHRVADFDVAKLPDQVKEQFTKTAKGLILEIDAHRPWVIKDPRLCLLFPLLRPLLEIPICVYVYRNPWQVAQSLRNRNGFPIPFGIALWEKYSLSALSATQGLPRLLVSYSQLMERPVETVQLLFEDLGSLRVQGLRCPSDEEIQAFIDPALFRRRGDASLIKKEFLNSTQIRLLKAFEDGSVLDFEVVPALSTGALEVLKDYEIQEGEATKLNERLAEKKEEAKKEVEALQSEIKERDAALVAKEAEVESIERKLQESLTKLEAKETEVEGLQVKLKERFQDIDMLIRWIDQLNFGISTMLSSRRWRFGNAIGELGRRVLFKPRVPMARDHLEKIRGKFHTWRKLGEKSTRLELSNSTTNPKFIEPQDTKPNNPHSFESKPEISVVSAVHNKCGSLIDYVEAFANQTYNGQIELILVDDLSTDGSTEIIQTLQKVYKNKQNIFIKLVKNQINVGNCGSRNKGIEHAEGKIIIVIDADCVVNPMFVEEHFKAHFIGLYDICIGSMGIESNDRDIKALQHQLSEDNDLLYKEMRLQYPSMPTAFLNCVTRNFSITKTFLDKIDGPLFDESFAYRKSPDSGFGWEDVEMGYRLKNRGAKVWFAEKALSIHRTHDPEIPDSDKPHRSVKNFCKLLSKHPKIIKESPDWVCDTYNKIEQWLKKYGYNDNVHAKETAKIIENVTRQIPTRKVEGEFEKLKIVTYRWHVGYQYDLWKLPYEFTLLFGSSRIAAKWDYNSRPLPRNAKFVRIQDKLDLAKFHLAILHFDEFALHPELAMGTLSKCWGEQFKYLMEHFLGPKVAICHGVPVYKGACGASYNLPDRGEIIDCYRKELVEYMGNTLVICNSHQAQKEWGFKNSKVIWQGFDPLMHPPSVGNDKIISVVGDIKSRPLYRGLNIYRTVMEKIGWKADLLGDGMPNTVRKPEIAKGFYRGEHEFGVANYLNYTHFLASYGIFFNPTLRSPMPRTRGEALMAGLSLVTTNSHDADMFIDHGYNGFVSNDSDEIAEILKDLQKNQDLRKKIGKRGRDTAMELFHVNHFIGDWEQTIEGVIGELDKSVSVATGSGNLYVYNRRRPRAVDHYRVRRIKRILYVGGTGKGSGTSRYRVDAAIESLQKKGVLAEKIHSDGMSSATESLYEGKYDVIIFHRVVESKSYEKLVSKAIAYGIRVIYDVDDLVFHNDYAAFFVEIGRKTKESVKKDVELFKRAIRRVDYAIATTPTLKDFLLTLGIRYVEIVGNTVSDDVLTMSNAAFANRTNNLKKEDIIIGYASGSPTHEKDLNTVQTVIAKILKQYTHVKICLIGEIDFPKRWEKFSERIRKIPSVNYLLLPQVLATFDINIAPLENRPFAEAKSELKYFEAGLVGVPTVATATVTFLMAIRNGETGFVARTEDEWSDYLKRLIEDRELRVKLGHAAREDSLTRYTSNARCDRLMKVLNQWVIES